MLSPMNADCKSHLLFLFRTKIWLFIDLFCEWIYQSNVLFNKSVRDIYLNFALHAAPKKLINPIDALIEGCWPHYYSPKMPDSLQRSLFDGGIKHVSSGEKYLSTKM